MNSYWNIDLESWPRREIFEFYRTFDAPCYNLTVKIAAEPIHAFAESRDESFFLLCLYAILRAANSVPQLRRRLADVGVIEFDRIAALTPIMTESESFHQVWCEYEPDFPAFKARVAPDIERAKRGNPSPLVGRGADFLCASCVPWMHFESIAHAEYGFAQTIPVLTWGKLRDGLIPIGVKFNHCFVDGLHASRFFDAVEHGFAAPETLFDADLVQPEGAQA